MPDKPPIAPIAEWSAKGNDVSSEPEFEAAVAAVYGMWAGDLRPLADYLRSGSPMADFVRRKLVSAIDGDLAGGFYKPLRLEAKGKIGAKTPLTELRAFARNLQLHEYFEDQLPRYDGDVEAAVAATRERFRVSRTTIMNARQAIRQWEERLAEEFSRANPTE